jgi:hypothetical protein
MSTGVGMSRCCRKHFVLKQVLTKKQGECCLSGKVHEGTPTGYVETIDNLKTYISAPQNGSKAKTIIFLVDSTYQTSPTKHHLLAKQKVES